MIALGIIHWQV